MVGGRVADGVHDLNRGTGEDGGPPRVEVVHPELAWRLRGVESLAEHGRAAVDHVVLAVETTVIPSVNSTRKENIVVEVEELRSLDASLQPCPAVDCKSFTSPYH